MTYDPSRRVYLVGTVKGDYEFNKNLIPDLPNYRKVHWDGEVERDRLSVPTKNTLGAIQATFQVSEEAANEIEAKLAGETIEPSTNELSETKEKKDLLKQMQVQSHEFIKDRINNLDWEEMQELIAGLLRAMGYKTRIFPAGSRIGF